MFYISALRTGQATGTEVMNRAQWHLKYGARDETIASHQLWAAYYFITGQIDNAINRQVLASQLNPDLWLETATLCGTEDRAEDRKRFLGRAEAHSRQAIDANPLDAKRRLMLVRVLVDRNELEAAAVVLNDGLKLEQSPEMKRASSDLVLLKMTRMDAVESESTDSGISENLRNKIRFIGQATQIDPSNPEVYRQWAALHDGNQDHVLRRKIREYLEKLIVEGEAVPFAHFTLGGILWAQGEQGKSLFHMERALEMDPRFSDAANNLAWVFATQEKPDLERADQLVRRALEQSPNDIRYLDTLSEILTRQSKWDEALTVMERLLPVALPVQRKPLHLRLAKVYENLGQEDFAKLHREKAESLK